ncbi:hypothetical protein EP331_01040 [bacterium]|nr:MAG: hypothetical protein EP331_01040 [bacterium]
MESFEDEKLYFNYTFVLEDGTSKSFTIDLDPDTLDIQVEHSTFPDWTRLEVSQCPNCPLTKEVTPYCPIALNMKHITEFFSGLFSYELADVTIVTPDRIYKKRVAIQDSLSSLMGIVMVTSGCPVLDKLRPMVRNHLPFASIKENLFRVISMYFMAQYMRSRKSLKPDWTLEGLADIYDEIKIVNQTFCERLGRLFEKDANLNAIVILNCLAEFASLSIKQNLLEDFESIFSAYLNE